MMIQFKQGDRVKFNDTINKGIGTVVGISTNEQAIIGYGYIIQPDDLSDGVYSSVYPYSHFVVFGSNLELLNIAE